MNTLLSGRHISIGLACLALGLGGDALAGRIERVGAASAGIRRLDKDGDGKLSRDEHAAGARQMFDAMDGNHDGKVTAAEMDAAMAKQKDRRPSRSMKARGTSGAERIKLLDRDGDGVVTSEEDAQAAKAMFDQMDSDKDGFLNSAELAGGHPQEAHKPPRGRH
jgi:hypothetical protein